MRPDKLKEEFRHQSLTDSGKPQWRAQGCFSMTLLPNTGYWAHEGMSVWNVKVCNKMHRLDKVMISSSLKLYGSVNEAQFENRRKKTGGSVIFEECFEEIAFRERDYHFVRQIICCSSCQRSTAVPNSQLFFQRPVGFKTLQRSTASFHLCWLEGEWSPHRTHRLVLFAEDWHSHCCHEQQTLSLRCKELP